MDNIDCAAKATCDCKEEDKWLQGHPDHVKCYRAIAIGYNGERKVLFETSCFAKSQLLHSRLDIDSVIREGYKQVNYGADEK